MSEDSRPGEAYFSLRLCERDVFVYLGKEAKVGLPLMKER